MDYGKILTRSFQVAFKNRALWVFGILLALFGEGARSSFNFPSGGSGSGSSSSGSGSSGMGDFGDLGSLPQIPSDIQNTIAIIVVSLCCIAIVWTVLTILLRFTSRGALIGLVQELEADGTTPTVRHGFTMGWERFRSLLGIALIINIPLSIISLVLIFIAVAPILVSIAPAIADGTGDIGNELQGLVIAGILGSLGLICCVGLLLSIVSFLLHPLYQIFVRECVVKKRAAMDSIREGVALVRANLGSVAVIYALSIGVSIGYGFAMFIVALVLIGIPALAGLIVYMVSSQAIVPALVVGGVLFVPMLAILLFIGGLYLTFDSTLWTEGYLALIKKTNAPPAANELPAST